MADREIIHLLPPSTEVKNEWSHTSTPPIYGFTAWTRKSDLHFYLSHLHAYSLMVKTYLYTFAFPLIYLELTGKFRDFFYQHYAYSLTCISKFSITRNHMSGHANSCSDSDTRCTYCHAIKCCVVFELYLKIPISFLSRKLFVKRTKATRCRKNY